MECENAQPPCFRAEEASSCVPLHPVLCRICLPPKVLDVPRWHLTVALYHQCVFLWLHTPEKQWKFDCYVFNLWQKCFTHILCKLLCQNNHNTVSYPSIMCKDNFVLDICWLILWCFCLFSLWPDMITLAQTMELKWDYWFVQIKWSRFCW